MYRLACHRFPPWLRVTFAMVPNAASPGSDQCLGVPLLPLARWVGWVAPACATQGLLVLCCPSAALRVCGVLGHLAPVHRCVRSVCCVAFAMSWATWLLFTGAPARCVPLLLQCPGPLGSCSPVCPRGLSRCVCGVLGHLTPVYGCANSVCCFAHETHCGGYFLRTKPSNEDDFFKRRNFLNCSNACGLGVLLQTLR